MTDVLTTARDAEFLNAHGITGPSAEGYLFPDTYYFVRGMRPEQMNASLERFARDVAPRLRQAFA